MKKLFAVLLSLLPVLAYGQAESQWVHYDLDGKLAYKTTERGDRMADFSHAGYKDGGVPLPDVPVKLAIGPLKDGSDCSQHIQEAIDSVSKLPLDKDGFRGAVLLLPGTYPCSHSIEIQEDGVVLRGSGSGEDGSVIFMSGDERYTAIVVRSQSSHHVGCRIDRETPGEKSIRITNEYIPAGSSRITVEDVSGLKAGDNVEIRKRVTQKWIDYMRMNDMYRDGKHETWIKAGNLLVAERHIAGIDGNDLVLDAPLIDSYDPEYTDGDITLVVANGHYRVRQCGVEHIRIQSPPQAVNHTVSLYYAMQINGEDCWARDVNALETMESVRIGGRRITLRDVNVIRKALHQGSSKPAEFAPNGTQILLDHCSVEGDNIWFAATGSGQTGPVVFLNCTFTGNGHVEGHQRWSTGMLLDNCKLPGGGIDFRNRGEMGSGHGWGTAWSVAWNCEAKSFVNQNPPGTQNWVIGCVGERQVQRRPFDKEGPYIPEGTYDSHGNPVSPESLYKAQFKERLSKEDAWEILSDNGEVRFLLSNKKEDLSYSVYLNGVPAMEESKLGFVLDGNEYGRYSIFDSASDVKKISENVELKAGKRLNFMNECKEQKFTFRQYDGRKFTLAVRVYDDGVAFRYEIEGVDGKIHRMDAERTEFAVPVKGKAWIHPYDWNGRKKPSYEQYCQNEIPIRSESGNGRGWGFPLLFNTNNLWMMVTEAHLDGTYPATHVDNSGTGKSYRIRFPEAEEPVVPDDPRPASTLPWKTPWRAIIVGGDLGGIFSNQMVEKLNPEPVLKDVSWIQPGRSSWSWWSNGGSARDYKALLRYVDLSARMGWEYTLLDSGWDRMKNGGTMEDVVEYAKSKGVGVLLWYHSGAGTEKDTLQIHKIMCDPVLRRAEMERISKIGVKGIKVDFFDTDKQRVIALYPQILEDAADFHLLVDFHGATLPRGFERTYPNLMTTEAVRGAESLGNQERCDKAAVQDATLPFTRNVVGSMDYTPVTFSNKVRRGVEAIRKTTMAHQLALSVVFESGIQCFADKAESYLSLPAKPKQYLQKVPAAWDESILLGGYPGEYVVVARRSGNRWFIGGINGSADDREVEIHLPEECVNRSLLIISDGEDKDSFSYRNIRKSGSTLKIKMLAGGGFAAYTK